MCPIKIDIGATYPCPPEDRSTIGAQFQPQTKELVFDIDMTDYDKIRFCCTGAQICHRCWVLMTAAIQITDKRLKSDFGFKHVMWIFSGRRGVHCWVADERARLLTTNARAAVVDYLSLFGEKSAPGEEDKRVIRLPKRLHPMVVDVCELARPTFEAYIEAQELLEHADRYKPLLEMLPAPETREELTKAWSDPNNFQTTAERWAVLKATVERDMKGGSAKAQYARAPHVLKEIMLAYVYPRYDAAVTRGFNHLLKSPFVVHPKTGRACVPIDASNAEAFDPLAVPTVLQLIDQIDTFDKQHGAAVAAETPHYKKTALAPYVEQFNEFLRGVQKSTRSDRVRAAQAAADPLSF